MRSIRFLLAFLILAIPAVSFGQIGIRVAIGPPALPVYDQPDLFLRLGNLLHEPVSAIWERYPYKVSHYAKYLGASIHTVPRAAR